MEILLYRRYILYPIFFLAVLTVRPQGAVIAQYPLGPVERPRDEVIAPPPMPPAKNLSSESRMLNDPAELMLKVPAELIQYSILPKLDVAGAVSLASTCRSMYAHWVQFQNHPSLWHQFIKSNQQDFARVYKRRLDVGLSKYTWRLPAHIDRQEVQRFNTASLVAALGTGVGVGLVYAYAVVYPLIDEQIKLVNRYPASEETFLNALKWAAVYGLSAAPVSVMGILGASCIIDLTGSSRIIRQKSKAHQAQHEALQSILRSLKRGKYGEEPLMRIILRDAASWGTLPSLSQDGQQLRHQDGYSRARYALLGMSLLGGDFNPDCPASLEEVKKIIHPAASKGIPGSQLGGEAAGQ